MTTIQVHGFAFNVEAHDFAAPERDEAAEMVLTELLEFPQEIIAALHANADNFDSRLYASDLDVLISSGNISGCEGNILDHVASRVASALVDAGGYNDSGNISHGIVSPAISISALSGRL